MLFPDARKQNTGDVVLQIPLSMCSTSHYKYEITNSDKKKPTTEHSSGKQLEN
jgi:hypothetical protein